MGIGIFALPAAVLSSAFTDQLQKEREALKGELFKMLEDGVISDEEAAIIAVKAKQLHLDDAEVALLIEQAKLAQEVRGDLSKLPLHKISQTPEHAIEHYKSLISEIRQLAILTDRKQFESVAQRLDRLTQSELALWRQIHGG